MKKIFILAIAGLATMSSYAQRSAIGDAQTINATNGYLLAKTAAAGDTFTLKNVADTSSLVIYPFGTGGQGYVTGTDLYDDNAFAELYTFNGADSSVAVIGVYAQFAGTVNPASTKTISFNIWNQGDYQPIGGNLLYNGFPSTSFDSLSVPVTQLGISATKDTLKKYLFATPATHLAEPFFAGYTMSYDFYSLNGDTIGLASTLNGVRKGAASYESVDITTTLAGTDTTVNTIYNVQNATRYSDGVWHDNYSDNDSLLNNLAIYPIVVIGAPTSVKGITRNNFTFFGNYPNPAVNSTNIKFSLSKQADVTIDVMDMNDRVVSRIQQTALTTGEHIVPLNTANLAAGDYLYLIRTSSGDGIAAKMTVVRR